MAADLPAWPVTPPPPIAANWTGFYLGVYLGGGVASTTFSDSAGPAIYGGAVGTPMALAGAQAGYNWQVPNTRWVLGVETDIGGAAGVATATCFASSGFYISDNCRVRTNLMGSATGRIGYAVGPQGRTLLFARGGAAWISEKVDIANLTNATPPTTSQNELRTGWTVGAGAEQAITPAWSLRLTYDYADFGSVSMATPASYQQVVYPFGYIMTPGGSTSVRQTTQTVKLGLNLKLGEDNRAHWEDDDAPLLLRGRYEPSASPEAEVEFGTRAWVSSGRHQKDLGATTSPSMQNILVSRLTYDTSAVSGEVFGRLDSSSDVFLKGFIGGGSVTSGKLHDEDWLIFDESVPYSNTLSGVKGSIAYGTIDAGYNFLHGRTYKFGGFIGYNYYRDDKSAYGCTQIANPNSDCVPALPSSTLVITENDRWNSVRVGVNGEVVLADRLKVSADAAYLPYSSFAGTDNHVLRTGLPSTLSPESGVGSGVQLEALLSYAVWNSFSIGAGGRYWAMWTTSNAFTNAFNLGCPCQTLPVRTERIGAFVQAAYQFGTLR